MQEIVMYLTKNNKTISFMESCTGGYLSNSITNIEGASNIIKFSAVTYSNDYKIKMGVDKDVIDKYSVYSIETAKEMSKKISKFANSNYGVGITGKLNRIDEYNNFGNDNEVFISIYDKESDTYYTKNIIVNKNTRIDNKKLVNDVFIDLFKSNVINVI